MESDNLCYFVFTISTIIDNIFSMLSFRESFNLLRTCTTFYYNPVILECFLSRGDVHRQNIKDIVFRILKIDIKSNTLTLSPLSASQCNALGHITISASFSHFYENRLILDRINDTYGKIKKYTMLKGATVFNYEIKSELYKKDADIDYDFEYENMQKYIKRGTFSISISDNDQNGCIVSRFNTADDFIRCKLVKAAKTCKKNPFDNLFYFDNSGQSFSHFALNGGIYDLRRGIKYYQYPEDIIEQLIVSRFFDLNFILYYQNHISEVFIEKLFRHAANFSAEVSKYIKDADISFVISSRMSLSSGFIGKNFCFLHPWGVLRPDIQISADILKDKWESWSKTKLITLQWFLEGAEYLPLRRLLMVDIATESLMNGM